MGSFVSDLFGGSDDSAQDAAVRQNAAATALFEKNAQQARSDALNIFPVSDENRNLGIQGALDAIAGGTGQQISAIQQGNVGAQDTLLRGLPQFQNAILGNDVNLSGMRPGAVSVDTAFLNRGVPEFKTIDGTVLPAPTPANQNPNLTPDQQNISTVLSAIFEGGGFNDPSDTETPDLSEFSDQQLADHMDIATFLGLAVPGFGLPSFFSKQAIQSEIDQRSEAGQIGDPGNPEGAPGSGGTGSGSGAGVGMGAGFGGIGVDFGGV